MISAVEHFNSKFTPPGAGPGGAVCISSLTGSADAFLALARTAAGGKPRIVLAVTPGLPDADRLADDLRILTEREPTRILELPPLVQDDKSSLGTRLKTVAALRAWALNPYPAVVVASFPALSSPIPRGTVPALRLELKGTVPSAPMGTVPQRFSDICAKFAEYGYNRVPMVEREGDWSVRGGIIDAWCPGEEFPIRAEFFGDDLESLRTFEASTQRSIAVPPTAHGINPTVTPGRLSAMKRANDAASPAPAMLGLSKCIGSSAICHFPSASSLNIPSAETRLPSVKTPRPAMFDCPASRYNSTSPAAAPARNAATAAAAILSAICLTTGVTSP